MKGSDESPAPFLLADLERSIACRANMANHPIRSSASPAKTASTWTCLRVVEAGKGESSAACMLDISVSPNAKRTELVGWHDGALRVRLAAPPVDGAANDALRRWLADELRLPQARITLVRGDTSRRKQWRIDQDPTLVTQWLARQPALALPGG